VARKCLEVPALKKQIDQGAISVTQARKITPVLTAANQDDLLTLAQNLSARKLEKEIATLYPKAATVEHIKYTSGKRLALQCGVSEELMLKLRRIQDLESTRQRKNINLEEALEAMVKVYLHHKDPLEKAKRQKARGKLLLKSSTKKDQSSNLNNSIDINGLNYSKHLNALNNSIDLNNLNNSKHSSNLKQSHLKQPQNKTIISKTSNKLPDSSQVQLLQIPQISSQIPENSQLPQASKVTSQLHQGPQSPERPQSSQKPGSGPARVKKLNQKVSTRIIKRSIKESIKRTPIPARIVHTVWLRDNNQCAFTDQNGKKCTNKRYLEIHHRVPVVNGGLNTPDNLTVLCSAHHKMHHLFNLLPAIN